MTKKKEIDLESVKKTFENMDSDKGKLGLSLLEEAEFMKQTLEHLKKNIKEHGVVTKMCQGNYDIDRANPALNQYNSLIKNYNSTIKQINDLLSSELPKSIEDEFDK